MSHDYERVRIQGHLQILSPLSIGHGGMPAEIQGKEGRPGNRLDICAHPDGTPFIPATSLRGLLRASLPESNEHHRELFGEMRGREKNQNQPGSKAGLLRVFDAGLSQVGEGGNPKQNRTRTAIDPITATAKDNCLYELAQVPADSRFQCEFELEKVSASVVQTFLGLLNLLSKDNPQSRLGRGANKSEGRVSWHLGKVQTLSPAGLAAWLLDGATDAPARFEDETRKLKAEPITQAEQQSHRFDLLIKLSGLMLVDGEEEEIADENGEKRKIQVFRRQNQNGKAYPVIPAASLRGLLRGHCRKILLTLLVDKTKESAPYTTSREKADKLIDDLFGHEGKASAIRLEDALGGNGKIFEQTFNAVDRFTGGVDDGALYTVKAYWQGEFKTTLRINPARIKIEGEWWKGLLVLALRDAMEGDMALGWGKAKGYGGFTLGLIWPGGKDAVKSWDELRQRPKLPDAQSWVKALHQTLESAAKDQTKARP